MKLLRLFLFWGLLAGPGLLRVQAQAVPGFDRALLYGLPAPGAGSNSQIFFTDCVVDPQGSSFVLGRFQDSVTFGSISTPAASGGVPNGGFLARLDANGTWTWFELLPQSVNFSALALDGQDNLYLTGGFGSYVVLGNTTLTTSSLNDYDIIVAKFDGANRTWSWAVKAGGSDNEGGDAVVVSPAGALYVAGDYRSPTAQFGATTLTLSSGTGVNRATCFLSRLDPQTGAWQWAVETGRGGNELGGLAADAGGVYVTGSFYGTTAFGAQTLTSTPSNPGQNLFVAKANPGTGAWLWASGTQSTFVGRGGGYYGGGIGAAGLATDGEGVYVAGGLNTDQTRFGATTLTNYGGQTTGPSPSIVTQNSDAFVARLSAATGVWAWAWQGGTTGNEWGRALTLGPGGQLYVAGTGVGQFGQTPPSGAGKLFVAGLDTAGPAGRGPWALQAGGSGSRPYNQASPVRLRADGQGRLHLASSFFTEPAAFPPLSVAAAGLPTTYEKYYLTRLSGGPLAVKGGRALAGRWTVYPNPASRGRAVSIVGLRSGQPVQVLDVLGREVARGVVPLGGGPLALTLPVDCATGLYLVRAAGQVRRLVVNEVGFLVI